MHKHFTLLAAVASIAFAAPAIAADETSYESKVKIEQDANGNLEKKTSVESKDSAGTNTSTETKTKVDVDSDGSVKKTTTSESVRDPEGLLNKEKTKTKNVVEHNADGTVSTHHKKTVNGETVEDTKTDSAR